jgi:hypothetical protein
MKMKMMALRADELRPVAGGASALLAQPSFLVFMPKGAAAHRRRSRRHSSSSCLT